VYSPAGCRSNPAGHKGDGISGKYPGLKNNKFMKTFLKSNTISSLAGVAALGVATVGFAVGAVAVGAIAIGALSAGRVAIKRGRIDRLSVGELTVDRLIIVEQTSSRNAVDNHQTVGSV